MYYQKLKNQLFVDIDYPKDITDLIADAEPWKKFCALPQEIKEKFIFQKFTNGEDIGYFLRKKSEGREDKEYFHVLPSMREVLQNADLENFVEGDKILKNFFEYTTNVYDRVHDFALSIGSGMAKEIPEMTKFVKDGKIHSSLRLLHYTNADDTEVIAAQHFDRSLYTLHLYESAPGLQFLDYDRNWKDAPIENGKTVVFNGYRIEKLTNGDLQKTWHRVVKVGEHRDRISIVLFVWAEGIHDYPKDARSQDLEPSYSKN